MNEQEIRALGNDCYGAFNMTPPSPSASAWRLWAEICADVPLEAATWIRAKLIELDSMPRNFGKAVRNFASDWRSETGIPRRAQACCPECSPEVPGFFYGWIREESGTLYSVCIRCLCNDNPAFDPMPRKSRAQAQREGYTLMPLDSSKTLAAFEHEMFRGQLVDRRQYEIGRLARRMARNPAPDDPARPGHVRQLEYAEGLF